MREDNNDLFFSVGLLIFFPLKCLFKILGIDRELNVIRYIQQLFCLMVPTITRHPLAEIPSVTGSFAIYVQLVVIKFLLLYPVSHVMTFELFYPASLCSPPLFY